MFAPLASKRNKAFNLHNTRIPMRITLFILAAALSIPLLASAKPYSTTSEFRDDKIVKGYLNIKLGTYGKMFEEPKGTSCDWVFVDPSFKVEDIRKESVLLYPDSITRNGGWDDSYWTMFAGLYGNGLVSSFESGVRTRGVQLQHPKPQTVAVAAPAATEPPSPSAIEQKIEVDRYEDDKSKVGLDEAIKRAEARGVKRREEWLAKQEQKQAEASSPAKGPEDTKGWVLVVYITESSVNANGAGWIPFVPMTNSTTGEFLLLHDGKPMLAARHNSVGAYSNSSPKCGTALASAFDIKMAN